MKNHIGQNVLVTTGNWFIAPDGKEYKACYGKLIAVIGKMIIMGCQGMYFVQTDIVNFDRADAWSANSTNDGINEYITHR